MPPAVLTLAVLLLAAVAGAAPLESDGDPPGGLPARRALTCEPLPAAGLSEFRLGIRAGLNFSQHTGTHERDAEYEVRSEWRDGLTAGFFLYWPVTRRFGLQQEVVYTQKGSRQTIGVEILEIPTELDVTYELDYVELPLLLRFTWLRMDGSALYSLTGTALSLKVRGRYALEGLIDDGDQTVPLRAAGDMSEVDMFDYSFVYGAGWEFEALGALLQLEYRFTVGWNSLSMPTYAYVPFDEEEILIDNEPVPLKNQTHCLTLGICF